MTSLTLFDHALALVLVVFFPIRSSTFGYRRLREAPPERVPQVRTHLYRQAMVLQWGLTGSAIALWSWQRRGWNDLGLVFHPTWVALGLIAACSVGVAVVLVQLPNAIKDYEALARVRHRLANLERMLPRTGRELKLFWALAFTAGVCEETLYRGFLFWYLGHGLPMPAVVGVGALIFGIGHSYQGMRGIMTTGLAGLVAGLLYVATGSLYLPMALHALMDAYSGYVGRAALRATEGVPVDTTWLAAEHGPTVPLPPRLDPESALDPPPPEDPALPPPGRPEPEPPPRA